MTDGWTALAESTGRLPGLALNLAQLQQQGQHMRAFEAYSQRRLAIEGDRMKLAEDQNAREQQAFDYDRKKKIEQDKIDNAFAPASLRFPKIHEFPTLKKAGIDALRTAGFEVKETPDDIYTTNKGYDYLNAAVKNNPAFAKTALESTITDLQNKSTNITKKIMEIQESGKIDDKQLPILKKQQELVKSQIGELFSTQESFVKEQMKQEQTEAIRKATEEGLNQRAREANKTRLQAAEISAAGKTAGVAPIGNIRAVGLTLAAKYLPLAKGNMGEDAEKLSEGLFMTDQFGRNVNEARLRTYLTPEQQKAYDWIKIEGERLSKTKTPAAAVDIAIKNYYKTFSGRATPKTREVKRDTEREDAESAIAAGKDAAAVKALYKKRTGKAY